MARARTSTRARSRANGAAPVTTSTVVCQERAPEHYDLGGARVVVPELPGGLLPVFVLDRYAGSSRGCCRTSPTAERLAYVDANAAALRELLPADLVFTNHVLIGGAGRRRDRRARSG